ncbi:MAG TPA: tetratricopeptide repeat protein [Caulobacteraceae bacterium]|jgi:tetratricopeptide (TPR) repeat protein|nr:tetratricopeptide repeat protein [Caulobacteraceae bacterium]
MIRIAAAAGAAALIVSSIGVFAPSQAKAAVTVLDAGGFASQCFHAAKYGGDIQAGIADCNRAIVNETLSDRNRAGTYVNRGVLYLFLEDYVSAQRDFEASVKLDPTLGEAYVNLGGVKIAQHQYAAGIADIDRGLALGPEEPEKAYFNRALADEGLDNIKAAYFDYSKAANLKPTWAPPRTELARFTVRQAP